MNAAARLWICGNVYAALPCSPMGRIRVLPNHACEQSTSEFGMGVQRKLLSVHPEDGGFGRHPPFKSAPCYRFSCFAPSQFAPPQKDIP